MQALTDLNAPDLAAADSPEGRSWMAVVPSLLHDLARRWNMARQLSFHDPVPGQWIALATQLAAGLADDPARLLIYTDLHYGNILASTRPGQPWVAIDPRAAAGSPERSIPDLLWTRADELPDARAITGLLAIIAQNGNLDHAKAAAWSFVRTIDYWLWGLQNGFTVDPPRCQRIASALAPLAARWQPPGSLRAL